MALTQHDIQHAVRVVANDGYDIGTVNDRMTRFFVVRNGTTEYRIPYGAVREVNARGNVILDCKLEAAMERYKVEAK